MYVIVCISTAKKNIQYIILSTYLQVGIYIYIHIY